MSDNRRTRSRTSRDEATHRAHADAQTRAILMPPAGGEGEGRAVAPSDQAVTASEDGAAPQRAPATDASNAAAPGWVGPTSEATRRLVAESRARQGLSPNIDNPAVIESLALFLRNALSTLDEDGPGGDGGV
ncbi:hypothetical protein AB0H71_17090 [Nocardia sp. NPDC050697]|uniref:hypothetical protein n=1 Tax=Nocardia sp. NPDC050697 TaxID=3155158 RepID=UPI0033C3227A